MGSNGRLRFLCMAALVVGAAPLHAQQDRVVLVIVDGQHVDGRDLALYMKGKAPAIDARLMPPRMREDLIRRQKREFLGELINRQLLLQQAKATYLGDKPERRFQELAGEQWRKLVDAAGGSEREARRYLASRGVTSEEYKRLEAEGVLLEQYLRAKVFSLVRVSPRELKDYYDRNKELFVVASKVVYHQIVLPILDEADRAEKTKTAGDLLARLRRGADFARLADGHSADAEKFPGGRHEVRLLATRPNWRPPAVEGLKPGQLSDVREIAGCLLIVRLDEIRPREHLPFARVQDEIEATLTQSAREQAMAAHLRKLRRSARLQYLPAARELGIEPHEDLPGSPE